MTIKDKPEVKKISKGSAGLSRAQIIILIKKRKGSINQDQKVVKTKDLPTFHTRIVFRS